MRISQMNWMQVEARLGKDDRCVLPLGCTEQHAYLSLSTDSILAERVSTEAAEPLGVPVFPCLPFGMTPSFTAYPGTISISIQAYSLFLSDILRGLVGQGFQRILIVNGHGGNIPARVAVTELISTVDSVKIDWIDWWSAPAVWSKVQSIDPCASHASWSENFPWTRLPGVEQPTSSKAMADFNRLKSLTPKAVKEQLGDGNCGGIYERADDLMKEIWDVAVRETRSAIQGL